MLHSLLRAHFSASLMAASLLVCAAPFARAETPPPSGDSGYDEAGRVYFDDTELMLITVTVDPADLQAMLDDPYSDEYHPCSVRLLGPKVDTVVDDVAIRPRGNTSRNAVKKSWKLKFNEFVPGREVFGLEKLNLNGHQNDPSVIRGKLAWDVYNAFGIPSPRASMVHLVINDGALVDDVYANVEQIDDEFLGAWFGDDTGNLYQCGYKGARADLRFVPPGDAGAYANLGDLTYELENDSGADQHADLAQFIAFIDSAGDEDFAAQIDQRFSVDNFLRSLAVDCANGHWDNPWYGANNFFLYANPDSGRFEYIPFDLDNTYGIDFFSTDWATRPALSFGDSGFGWDYDSSLGGGPQPPLVRRIMQIDAYRDQYLRYVRQLVGAIGDPEAPQTTTFPDTRGDTFNATSEPHFDLLRVDLRNDQSDLLAEVSVAGPIDVGGGTDNARIIFFFDTRPGGSTGNPWGRDINTSVQADYFLGTWTDNGGGFLFYEWNGGGWDLRHASYDNPGGISQDLSSKADGVERCRVPLARLGMGDNESFSFDVVTTNDRGQSTEPGVDHLSNPERATPDYDTPSTPGPYLQHTLIPFVPGNNDVFDGIFTLAARGAHIDAVRDLIAPYAFTGSYSDGAADYGFDHQSFLDSFDFPASYSGGSPDAWGLRPYIEARTAFLRTSIPAPAPLPRIFINEVLASNASIIMDEAGEFEDFIELYNDEGTPVDVSGMHLSDDPGSPRKWMIPEGTLIAPGSFLLVFADNEPADGPLHASFKLSAGGETLTLSHNDLNGAVLIDSLRFPGLPEDQSFGRAQDGSSALVTMCAVTPGAPNDDDDSCFSQPDPAPRIFINEWLASNDGSAADEFGDEDDYIELYNDEDIGVDLGGRYLSDDLDDRTKWEIPPGVTIGAKSRLVFWADDEPGQGPMHTSFKLSAGGESIGLFDRPGNQFQQIDALDFGAQSPDIAQGRGPDGAACLAFFAPSPGAPNPNGRADLASPIGVLNFFDISAYLGALADQEPIADFTGDGVLNFFDISAFLGAYRDGGCP